MHDLITFATGAAFGTMTTTTLLAYRVLRRAQDARQGGRA